MSGYAQSKVPALQVTTLPFSHVTSILPPSAGQYAELLSLQNGSLASQYSVEPSTSQTILTGQIVGFLPKHSAVPALQKLFEPSHSL